jgi:hypothetical protein
MIVTATMMASLMVVSLSGSQAKGQIMDRRLPPIGLGSSGFDRYSGHRAAPRGDWAGAVAPTASRRHGSAFPGHSGPIGHHPGSGYGPQFPGGFPTGGFPTTPGFGGHGHGHDHGQGHGSPGFGGHGGRGGACPPGVGHAPVIGLVDQLIAEVGAFLEVFGPTAHIVPQGERMYRDAIDLHQAAVGLRQAALGGASPHELRKFHQRMERSCGRLVSRVDSVARGRSGPNIEQVRYIGALCHRLESFL